MHSLGSQNSTYEICRECAGGEIHFTCDRDTPAVVGMPTKLSSTTRKRVSLIVRAPLPECRAPLPLPDHCTTYPWYHINENAYGIYLPVRVSSLSWDDGYPLLGPQSQGSYLY